MAHNRRAVQQRSANALDQIYPLHLHFRPFPSNRRRSSRQIFMRTKNNGDISKGYVAAQLASGE